MKKMFLGLLLLLGQLASAQNVVIFPKGDIATEQFVRSYVDSILRSKPVSLPPTNVKDACERGPYIETIANITSDSLFALFDGKDVFGVDYQIFHEGKTIYSSSILPRSNVLKITYPTLAGGEYTLRLAGNTCVGSSTRPFTVPSRVTVPTTPVATALPPCEEGPEVRAGLRCYQEQPHLPLSCRLRGGYGLED